MPGRPHRAEPGPLPLARAAPPAALAGWLLLAWVSRAGLPAPGLVYTLLGVLAAQWALALWALRRPAAWSCPAWVAWGVAFRLAGLAAVPVFEDDHHRFLWDGRVFALTGDPYATTPIEHFGDEGLPDAFAEHLDRINHPDVPTIYGPVTEAGFLLAYLVAPGQLWPWKVLLLLAEVALMLLVWRLAAPGGRARTVAFVALCPLSVFETAFNAHPEALAVALATGAVAAQAARRGALAGLLGGLAVAAKAFAAVVVLPLAWMGGWRAVATCAATALACYSPFWLQGSTADLAGLRTMASDWEFNSSGFALVQLLAGDLARPVCAALTVAGLAILALRWVRAPDPPAPPGLAMFAWVFLWSPVFNPWYALWALPFVALSPSPGGFALLAAVSLSYLTHWNLGVPALDGFAHPAWVRPVEFGAIALAFLAGWMRHGIRARSIS